MKNIKKALVLVITLGLISTTLFTGHSFASLNDEMNNDAQVVKEEEAKTEIKSNAQISERGITADGIEDVVEWMPDAKLREEVATELGINEADITKEAMEDLIYLFINSKGIQDIAGLEYATELKELHISGNNIQEVTLKNMPNLEYVSAQSTKMQKIKLENLPKLESLQLSDNALRSISTSGITQLTHLDLSQNLIREIDINNLSNLVELRLNGNRLTTIDIKYLNELELIELSNNLMKGIELKDLPVLNNVNIDGNEIIDLQKVKLENINSAVNISIQAQKNASKKMIANESNTIFFCKDLTGNNINWTIPGTANVDYQLSGANLTWKTLGVKALQASFSNGQIQYSADWNHIVAEDVDAAGWEKINVTGTVRDLITNTFTKNGETYKVESGYYNNPTMTLNEVNKVTNLTTGEIYTYAFSKGTGQTSYLLTKTGNDPEYDVMNGTLEGVYIKKDASGQEWIKKVYTYSGVEYELITTVTKNGEIRHNVSIKNISNNPINNLMVLAMVDTQFNGDDQVKLYATGTGGTYLTDNRNFTLYCEPLEGASKVYGGQWKILDQSEFDQGTKVVDPRGKAKGELMLDYVEDSAVYYGPNATNLGVGQTISFAFQERILEIGEEPLPVNAVDISYVDENGNEIKDSEIMTGSAGTSDSFEADKTITGEGGKEYEFVKAEGITLTKQGDKMVGTVTYTYGPQSIVLKYKTVGNSGKPEKPEKPSGKGKEIIGGKDANMKAGSTTKTNDGTNLVSLYTIAALSLLAIIYLVMSKIRRSRSH